MPNACQQILNPLLLKNPKPIKEVYQFLQKARCTVTDYSDKSLFGVRSDCTCSSV